MADIEGISTWMKYIGVITRGYKFTKSQEKINHNTYKDDS